MTLDDFAEGWLQHTGQSGLDVVGQLINDVVVTNINALFLRLALCRAISCDIKANDDGSRSSRQVYIGFTDIADTLADKAHFDILFADFCQCILNRLRGSLDVALEHKIQFLDFTLLHLHVKRIKADLPKRHTVVPPLFRYFRCLLFVCALIANYLETITSITHFWQTKNADRCAWWCLLYALTTVIEHGAYFA